VNCSTGIGIVSIMAAKGRGTVLPLPDGIAAAWGLPPEAVAEPLGGGYHNTLLRVDDVVVRIEQRAAESVAWEHELLAWLAPAVPEALQPLRSRDGTTYRVVGDTTVSLLPYVEGTHEPTPDLPEILARVHRRGAEWPDARPRPGRPAYADLDWERNDWWDWPAIADKPPELVRAFEHARAWVASAPPLVVTPVHGDLAPQNVLTRGGRVVALLDWEYARLEWPALELANAAWTYSEDDPPRFVAAYVRAGGPGEPDVLHEGIRIRLLANALYALTHSAWNRDWIAYLLARLRELP
jgi:Ser/Thr protein kinase RdoA (MazF antagonist)